MVLYGWLQIILSSGLRMRYFFVLVYVRLQLTFLFPEYPSVVYFDVSFSRGEGEGKYPIPYWLFKSLAGNVLLYNLHNFLIIRPTQFQPGSHLGQSSLSSALRGEEGGPPCHIGIQEARTYIYRLFYTTHWAPGSMSSWSFTAVIVLEEPVTTWTDSRSLLHCLQQSSVTYSGSTASFSPYSRDSRSAEWRE